MVICIRRGHFSISSFRLSCGLLFAPFFVRGPPSSYPTVPTKLLEALKIYIVELEVKREPACSEYLGSFSDSVRLQSRISNTDHFRQGIGYPGSGRATKPNRGWKSDSRNPLPPRRLQGHREEGEVTRKYQPEPSVRSQHHSRGFLVRAKLMEEETAQRGGSTTGSREKGVFLQSSLTTSQ